MLNILVKYKNSFHNIKVRPFFRRSMINFDARNGKKSKSVCKRSIKIICSQPKGFS